MSRNKVAIISFLYGAAVFWAAPLFTSARDPFDSVYPILGQFPAFIATAFLLRKFRTAPILWLLAGEATFPILKGSNLWPLSIIVTAVYMVPGIVIYAVLAKVLGKRQLETIQTGDPGQSNQH